jgi:hypothetical protein
MLTVDNRKITENLSLAEIKTITFQLVDIF